MRRTGAKVAHQEVQSDIRGGGDEWFWEILADSRDRLLMEKKIPSLALRALFAGMAALGGAHLRAFRWQEASERWWIACRLRPFLTLCHQRLKTARPCRRLQDRGTRRNSGGIKRPAACIEKIPSLALRACVPAWPHWGAPACISWARGVRTAVGCLQIETISDSLSPTLEHSTTLSKTPRSWHTPFWDPHFSGRARALRCFPIVVGRRNRRARALSLLY